MINVLLVLVAIVVLLCTKSHCITECSTSYSTVLGGSVRKYNYICIAICCVCVVVIVVCSSTTWHVVCTSINTLLG